MDRVDLWLELVAEIMVAVQALYYALRNPTWPRKYFAYLAFIIVFTAAIVQATILMGAQIPDMSVLESVVFLIIIFLLLIPEPETGKREYIDVARRFEGGLSRLEKVSKDLENKDEAGLGSDKK